MNRYLLVAKITALAGCEGRFKSILTTVPAIIALNQERFVLIKIQCHSGHIS